MKTISTTITYTCDFCTNPDSVVSANLPNGWIEFSSTKTITIGKVNKVIPASYCVCPTCSASADPNVISKIKSAVCGNPS